MVIWLYWLFKLTVKLTKGCQHKSIISVMGSNPAVGTYVTSLFALGWGITIKSLQQIAIGSVYAFGLQDMVKNKNCKWRLAIEKYRELGYLTKIHINLINISIISPHGIFGPNLGGPNHQNWYNKIKFDTPCISKSNNVIIAYS